MRKQIDKKQLVGRIDNTYYICNYLFDDGPSFKGATATILEPIPKALYEEQTDPNGEFALDYFEEFWRMAVQDGATTDSLADYTENFLNIDGDEAIYDFSGCDYWDIIREAVPELTEEEYPVFTCVGGGRGFGKNMVFDEVYDQELLEEIMKYES